MWRQIHDGLWEKLISAPHLTLRLEAERRVTTWRARLVRCSATQPGPEHWVWHEDHPTLEAAQGAAVLEVRKMAGALLEQVSGAAEIRHALQARCSECGKDLRDQGSAMSRATGAVSCLDCWGKKVDERQAAGLPPGVPGEDR